jgi:hypothetical protein
VPGRPTRGTRPSSAPETGGQRQRAWLSIAGTPDDVLTTDLVTDVFGIRVAIITDLVSGRPLVSPIGSRHTGPADR